MKKCVLIVFVTVVAIGSNRAAGADIKSEWLRYRMVDGWMLRYSIRVDDQVQWTRGAENHQETRVESLSLAIPLTQASGKTGALVNWTGTGEADVSLYRSHHMTNPGRSGGNTSAGGGKVQAKAILYMDLDKGTYYVWVDPEHGWPVHKTLDSHPRRQPAIHSESDYPAGKNGESPSLLWLHSYKKEKLPENGPGANKGLKLSGGRDFPVDEWLAAHPTITREANHIEYPHEGSYQWQLVPMGEELLEVVVEAKDYDKWMPGAGMDEKHAGNFLNVEARLQRIDGKPLKHKAKRFTFELEKVSQEPGICMNYPMGGKALDTADLAFEPTVCGLVVDDAKGQTAHTAKGDFDRSAVKVSCFDRGAFGQLKVTAEMEDGELIVGHLAGKSEQTRLLIPRRSPGSNIAEYWKETAGVKNLPDDDDSEKLPSVGNTAGDGFTLYEEYRGFMENGKYFQGDPKKVDFFVRNYIGADAAPGINLFEDLTGAAVHHRLNDKEFDKQKRVMNVNHAQGAHAVDQHGIHLVTAPGFDGAQTVFSKAGVRGRPVITMRIEVQPREAATPTMTNENARVSDAIFAYDRAVAHELVHSVGAEHHGAGDMHWGFSFAFTDDPRNKTGKPQFWLSGTTRAVEITDEKTGRPLAEVWEPDLMLAREKSREYFTPEVKDRVKKMNGGTSNYTLKEAEDALLNDFFGHHYWYIGAENGESSGDEGCIMRYSFASLYDKKGKSFAWYYISQKHSERLGMELCTSAKGTGINDARRKPQPRYGDAMRGWGPCADRIIFNDAVPLEKAP
ncbi:MAG: hypothetical protein JWN51_13 [Phycisphaerales bacterium]|nr:hypothetical protein [Phycisphaerales bacterium]